MGISNNDLYFLRGGGEMGKLIREIDWGKTPLGDAHQWPSSLRTMVAAMLENPFAMLIVWGNEHIQLYNDGFRPILGTTKHPEAFGKSAAETFAEIWQFIGPMFNQVMMKGESIRRFDDMYQLNRNGFVEDCYFDFAYSPIRKEDGEIGGILVTVLETTGRKQTQEALKESEKRVRTLVENVPFPIAVYEGAEMRIELANQSIINIWGKGGDVIGKTFTEILPELENQLVFEQIKNVYATGASFHTKNTPLDLVVDGKPHKYYFNYSFTPLHDAEGKIYGVMNTGVDLTDLNIAKKKIEESEQAIRSMVLQAPIGICVIDAKTLVSEIVNETFIEIAGKPYEQIAGRHYWETFAEAKPYYEAALDSVVKDGVTFYANEVELMLIRHGKEEIVYVTFVYAPLKGIDGEVKKVAIWVVDNTQQVAARKKIEEADKRFRTTVKQAPVGITILRGPQYIVEMANDAYLELIDRKEAEFTGKPLFDSLPEVESTVRPLLDSVLTTGIPYHGNDYPIPLYRHGKEEVFYFDFLYYPLKEDNGKISGVIVTVTEVSEKLEARKKIEQNEERLSIVVEASELGTWELNLKTLDLRSSERYLEILTGDPHDKIITHPQLVQHIHPQDLKIRERAFKKALSTGYLHYEARVVWNDKTIHWIEAKGKIFYDEQEEPAKLIGTIRDITEEKKHQQELEASEKRYRNLIIQSPVPKAILKGKNHVVEMANTALMKNIWKKEESEVIGKKIFDVFPELKQQKYADLLDEVYTTGKVHAENESFIFVREDLEYNIFYIDFEFAPLREADNSISGIKVTVIDVTEKVEARKKVEESETRFRSLTESIPQLIWETDERGSALFASGKWKEYTGVSPDGEAEWRAIIHPDDMEENAKTWKHSLATGEKYKSDVRLKGKDGNYRWHTVIGEPVYDKENNIIKWVGAFTDIQSEKTFTNELERQVSERTKELELKNVDLEKINKELQSFAYISSHDLQEPLRKIQTFSSQILEREYEHLSASGKDRFMRMENAAKRMQTLIEDLLTYSRTNTQERKFVQTDLTTIVEEVKEDLKEELEQKHATVTTGEFCAVNIIPFQFRQLLYNLISNSLKFSNGHHAPHIEIKAESNRGAALNNDNLKKEKTYCHISIADNGIGFEQQYSDKIFEVFQRLHGKNEYTGTGIGLAIVKKIVENHNGIITATGKLKEGAVFDIYIPVE